MPPEPLEIRVHKSQRKLEVWNRTARIHCFSIGLGRSPLGHKEREGDCRTPEGSYRVCVKNPKSRFHLSLGLDYPSVEDARRDRGGGVISVAQLEQIECAHRQGRRPPWDTPLGGEIYIHGGLEDTPDSRGCIALLNRDMEILFELISVGTRVELLA